MSVIMQVSAIDLREAVRQRKFDNNNYHNYFRVIGRISFINTYSLISAYCSVSLNAYC